MQKTYSLQDIFLNQVRKEKTPVLLYLVNGYQLKGIVSGFDSFTIIIEADEKQMVVYKHAVATIAPVKAVKMRLYEPKQEGGDEQ